MSLLFHSFVDIFSIFHWYLVKYTFSFVELKIDIFKQNIIRGSPLMMECTQHLHVSPNSFPVLLQNLHFSPQAPTIFNKLLINTSDF